MNHIEQTIAELTAEDLRISNLLALLQEYSATRNCLTDQVAQAAETSRPASTPHAATGATNANSGRGDVASLREKSSSRSAPLMVTIDGSAPMSIPEAARNIGQGCTPGALRAAIRRGSTEYKGHHIQRIWDNTTSRRAAEPAKRATHRLFGSVPSAKSVVKASPKSLIQIAGEPNPVTMDEAARILGTTKQRLSVALSPSGRRNGVNSYAGRIISRVPAAKESSAQEGE